MDDVAIIVNRSTLEVSSSGAVTGGIHVAVGSEAFPDVHWNDFVVIVLGWWCKVAVAIVAAGPGISGSARVRKMELPFMDGPFSMSLQPSDTGRMSLELVQRQQAPRVCGRYVVARSALRRELRQAGALVLRFCHDRGLDDEDVRELGVWQRVL